MIIVSFILGILLVESIAGDDQRGRLFRLAISLPIGVACSSLILFGSLLIVPTAYEMLALLIHCLLCALLVQRHKRQLAQLFTWLQLSRRLQLYHIGLLAAMTIFIGFGILFTRAYPYGLWDAFTMWNLKAKYLFFDSSQWIVAFRSLTHPDYPPLLPICIAWGWWIIGVDTLLMPIILAGSIGLSILIMLYAYFARYGRGMRGVLGAFVVGTAPRFLMVSFYQFAEVFLASFFLVASLSLLIGLRERRAWYGWITGMAVGAASFTKNEGLLFTCIFFLVLLVFFVRMHHERFFRSFLLKAMVGSFPFLLATMLFKMRIHYVNYLVASLGNIFFYNAAMIFYRAKTIIASFFLECTHWGVVWVCILMAFVLNGFFFKQRAVRLITTVFLVMAIGYFCVFMIVPVDVKWALEGYLHRALFHLFPVMVVLMLEAVYCRDNKTQSQGICLKPA